MEFEKKGRSMLTHALMHIGGKVEYPFQSLNMKNAGNIDPGVSGVSKDHTKLSRIGINAFPGRPLTQS